MAMLPLLAIYETGVHFAGTGTAGSVRNAVDVLLRHLLGSRITLESSYLLAAGAIGLIAWRLSRRPFRLPVRWVGLFVVETAAWAVGILLFLRILDVLNLASLASRALSASALVAGAAVYEELAYRLAILGGTQWLVLRAGGPPILAGTVSLWTSAFAFAASHYYGPFASPLESCRLFGHIALGLAFGCVYLLRGIGAAMYTHAFYDAFVLLL